MKSSGDNTFKPGNTFSTGRKYQSRNAAILHMQRVGEENAQSLYDMLVAKAQAGDHETSKWLLNKVLPDAKGCRMIEVELPTMENIERVGEAQDKIMGYLSKGEISLDESEKLFALCEQRRKVIENKEIIERYNEIDARLTQGGL